jgi:hypothetical protein
MAAAVYEPAGHEPAAAPPALAPPARHVLVVLVALVDVPVALAAQAVLVGVLVADVLVAMAIGVAEAPRMVAATPTAPDQPSHRAQPSPSNRAAR